MSRRRDHIIERFEAWWKIANKSLGLFVENVEKDRCVGSIFGNQFHFLLMLLEGVYNNVVVVLEGNRHMNLLASVRCGAAATQS
jgi:hypothetical protein